MTEQIEKIRANSMLIHFIVGSCARRAERVRQAPWRLIRNRHLLRANRADLAEILQLLDANAALLKGA